MIHDDKAVAGRQKRGRPKAADPSVNVSSRIPQSTFDALAKSAHEQNQSLSALVRILLQRQNFRTK